MSETKQKRAAEVDAAASAMIQAAKVDAAKQRAEALQNYGKRVKTLSHRQLRGELKRMTKDGPGLNAAYAVVSLIVLDNTKTKENPFAKLSAYPR